MGYDMKATQKHCPYRLGRRTLNPVKTPAPLATSSSGDAMTKPY